MVPFGGGGATLGLVKGGAVDRKVVFVGPPFSWLTRLSLPLNGPPYHESLPRPAGPEYSLSVGAVLAPSPSTLDIPVLPPVKLTVDAAELMAPFEEALASFSSKSMNIRERASL